MRSRLTKLTAAVAALAALAVGGSAIASATQKGPAQKPPTQVEQKASVDNESDAAEGPESQKAETAENEQEVPDGDGPGGHADDPGNPDADHQFEGKE